MALKVFDNLTGKVQNSDDVELADKVIGLKKNKDPWTVIEQLVDAWAKRTPEEFEAFKVHLDYSRQDLKDKEFGKTDDQSQDRRLLMIFPQSLHSMIRSIYKPSELAMDKLFFIKFSQRFPFFRMPEKV